MNRREHQPALPRIKENQYWLCQVVLGECHRAVIVAVTVVLMMKMTIFSPNLGSQLLLRSAHRPIGFRASTSPVQSAVKPSRPRTGATHSVLQNLHRPVDASR